MSCTIATFASARTGGNVDAAHSAWFHPAGTDGGAGDHRHLHGRQRPGPGQPARPRAAAAAGGRAAGTTPAGCARRGPHRWKHRALAGRRRRLPFQPPRRQPLGGHGARRPAAAPDVAGRRHFGAAGHRHRTEPGMDRRCLGSAAVAGRSPAASS
ncbi:hypothetical protein G6F50_015500 [Rhizopus delemar]|uniref:Uncharacterized protein n=1 Tax=Rhizopus delemar TaxID=936053 RepID=A0A9P7C4A6_9FUNG|nr:hypothetical protein G6F50_015500 [Rhizopus delemar]